MHRAEPMPAKLIAELGCVFAVEADRVYDAYAWPPIEATDEQLLEVERLSAIAGELDERARRAGWHRPMFDALQPGRS